MKALTETQHFTHDAPPTTVLGELVTRHEHSLLGFLIDRLHDREAAQDCLQDTFERAYEALLKGKSINSAWLFQVARNRAIDHYRERQRFGDNGLSLEDVLLADHSDDGAYARVGVAVNCLSSHDRELLYLAHVDGLTSSAIGEGLKVRPGAIRMRLFRARKRFRVIYRHGQ